MGYESKLYVISKGCIDRKFGEKTMTYAGIVASFDLCKVGIDFSKYPPTKYFIYAEDGDDETIEDKYGDPLRELTLEEAVKEIEKAMDKEPSYRRWKPCLAMLREFRDANKSEWDNDLAVLHYGY